MIFNLTQQEWEDVIKRVEASHAPKRKRDEGFGDIIDNIDAETKDTSKRKRGRK